MPLEKINFGEFEGQSVPLYVLENARGMRVKITPYGATVTSISFPGEAGGERTEVAAGFDSLGDYFGATYRANAPYFGCTVGRYASRIKDGKFSVEGKEYTVATNDGSNHLHGGMVGFDKQRWAVTGESEDAVTLSLHSPDGDEGYPGNLTVSVRYRLTDDNGLEITYGGETDGATPLSLTNHTYFNLSGFRETIHAHTARIDAREFLSPDASNVPVGERSPVAGTPADLREDTLLADALDRLPTGFEHYYAFPDPAPAPAPREVARFAHPASGRELRVLTTEPGALFYTGYFTSDDLRRDATLGYGRYRAFCFETSRYPNGPNLADARGAVLYPGERFASTTIYQFNH